MSQQFFEPADGRIHKARRAIRKLIALGISKRDVNELMSLEGRRATPAREGSRGPDLNKETRRRRSQWAIRTLIALGFSEGEIADLAGVDRSSITHALGRDETRSLGAATVQRLLEAVETAGAQRLRQLLPRAQITILDTCCDKGRPVDEATRAEIADGVRTDLLNALVFGSSPAPIVPGILSFLAQVGDPIHGLYVFKAPFEGVETDQDRIVRLQLSEHELEHILRRFREERWRLEARQRCDADLPPDGSIA